MVSLYTRIRPHVVLAALLDPFAASERFETQGNGYAVEELR